MMIAIIGVALCGVFIICIFKEIKPSFAVLLSVVTCVIIFSFAMDNLSKIITQISSYLGSINLSSELFSYLLKIIGISYIIEFIIDIAEDSGCTAIANKLAFAGKVIIVSISLPMLFNLLDIVMELI